MIEVTFCYPPYSPFLLRSLDENCSVSELKTKLFSLLPGMEGNEGEMRLVCGGRVLQDQMSISSQGVGNGAKVYVAIKKISSIVISQPKPMKPNPENDPLIAPLLKFLSDNPELYQQMIMSNPQMQKLIEKNPELRHALSDPSTLKSMLKAATNPKAYNEMLRGHDRAMSNLENIPEGFSHLKKVYSTLQEPMFDAFTPKMQFNASNTGDEGDKIRMTTSEPIPNPWAPKPTRVNSPSFKAQARKRKLNSSLDDDDELFNRSLAGMGLSSPHPPTNTNLYPQQLMEMRLLGFVNDEENVAALLESDGNVPMAIDRIMARRNATEKK